jgi:predicted protein tyrosine phosphatase
MRTPDRVSRNRLANVNNYYQGKSKKVLCVCSAGLLRSPTAAWVLGNTPFNFNTRAVGLAADFALIPLDAAHLAWADVVLVMDRVQHVIVRGLVDEVNATYHLPYSSIQPEIYSLDIEDNFGFKDPELIELITEKCKEIFKNDIKL